MPTKEPVEPGAFSRQFDYRAVGVDRLLRVVGANGKMVVDRIVVQIEDVLFRLGPGLRIHRHVGEHPRYFFGGGTGIAQPFDQPI